MNIRLGVGVISVVMLVASCSTSPSSAPNSLETMPLTSAYNQAYSDNYEVDTIEEIILNARHSYVLLDPFSGQDLSGYIEEIKANDNEVSAYISVGTGEVWRADYYELQEFLVGKEWGDWAGEYFVNQTNTGIVEVMMKRIDQIAEMGFDWVEFDNMDWAFDDRSRAAYGFEVTVEESIAYYEDLCAYAKGKGLKCMAKSLSRGIDGFDGATFESSSEEKNWWSEADLLDFIAEGDKLVLIVHYDETECDEVYEYYLDLYGEGILFITEDTSTEKYRHY